MPFQAEFFFGASEGCDGFAKWRQERASAERTQAREAHLPIGRVVEVVLQNGMKLSGRLSLNQPTSIEGFKKTERLELRIGRVQFTNGEIESCVRLD